jgi:endonuclease/exonuclease/phosphatase family metal-dependent hydrolase
MRHGSDRLRSGVFRLLSWNVLADVYVQPEFYPHIDPALLAPEARTAGIVAYLAASDADVACLQEAEPALIEALRAGGGWDVHFASKLGKLDGCALLARRAIILEDVRTIVFADGAPDRHDSGHIALCATLRHGGTHCDVATTHLRWDPPGTASEARWATRQVSQMLRAFPSIDLAIVCGDLNVEPTDIAYRMLLEAGLVDPMAADLRPTANPNGHAKRIDHVLCGRSLAAVPLPIVEVDDATPLPSPEMPSDHVPVGVTITIGAQGTI